MFGACSAERMFSSTPCSAEHLFMLGEQCSGLALDICPVAAEDIYRALIEDITVAGWRPAVGPLSSETGQMSAAKTGLMSAVETRKILKSQMRRLALNHQK